MADFWIKIEKGTPDKPEILELADLLGIEDPDTVTGKMIRVWSWFDSNSENGHAPIVTKVLLDRMTGVTGLTEALVTVGWLNKTDNGYSVPNFERHLGKGAKKRASDAERKRKSRDKSQQCHTETVTKNGTELGLEKRRVEKRREDNKEVINTQSAKANIAFDLFNFWIDVMRKNLATTKFTAKRKKAIEGRLKDGYSPEEIQAAIINCSKSNFHMGQNERNTKYNDIELICRPDKFEQFRDNVGQHAQPRKMSIAAEKTINNIMDMELD